jgi:hypothetical protein
VSCGCGTCKKCVQSIRNKRNRATKREWDRRHRIPKPPRSAVCAHTPCSATFVTSNGKKRYCSRKCKEIAGRAGQRVRDRKRYRRRTRMERHCADCGRSTGVGTAHRKLCENCSQQRSKDNRRKYRRLGLVPRDNCHRRRARNYGCHYEPVNRWRIFERDGYICQVCGIPTPKELSGKHKDNSPELGHIIDLADLGPHRADNTQCECRKCNQEKNIARMRKSAA